METVVLKKQFQIKEEYFKTLVADPDDYVRTTDNVKDARTWNADSALKAESKARSFADDNNLKELGFSPVVVNV